jgi:protein farnesyltransferase subunit beta
MAFEILVRELDTEGHPTETTNTNHTSEGHFKCFARAFSVLLSRAHIDYCLEQIEKPSVSGMYFESFCPWNPFYVLLPLRVLDFDTAPEFPAIQQRLTQYYAHRRCCGLFSGFPNDYIHLVTCYAGVSGIALIGTDEAYELIDRQMAYRAIMACKLPNGAFMTAVRMEYDVRATFSALLIASRDVNLSVLYVTY